MPKLQLHVCAGTHVAAQHNIPENQGLQQFLTPGSAHLLSQAHGRLHFHIQCDSYDHASFKFQYAAHFGIDSEFYSPLNANIIRSFEDVSSFHQLCCRYSGC